MVITNDDSGKSLIERLTYTKENAEQKLKPKHSIKFKGKKGFLSIYEGTHSLLNAVKIYFEYKRQVEKTL